MLTGLRDRITSRVLDTSSTTKLAGLLLPAFTPRRRGDLRIDDTKALSEMIDWAAATGIGFLQLLPVNETGTDESPYSAISSAAFEPIYLTLDSETLPWVDEGAFEKGLTPDPNRN